ncbi:MAG: 50S ribosomal protein L30 [Thermotoga sp. 50_1627]|uniref:50S ribosomal protein L30 n=1 Tax=Pseudothermotoga sp. TaxID=2033661 RepID=UPI00076D53EA|nr:MAG: 50S ribosomal protein L30 [Thermotoga sp. 50_64]KUK25393.1 MAG: 50S ribosomal protein L30 [Thermotoga sp. 50_1627]MBC7116788.1 50S ribosomal protein L30 [Pseudothermotoga sp.]MDK2923152.1 large subunit ribosomal protein [Pseudothermotoga sp.]HBT39618.1 50S ribosomal protein L30 [Pseudothermotoga sp.]
MARIIVELVKSPIGYRYDQRATLKALGLKKLHDRVVKPKTPQVLGMIKKVRHLVKVDEISEEE